MIPADVLALMERDTVRDDTLAMGEGAHILDVIEGLGGLFHEHFDAITRWPWKTFCARWRRMIAQGAKRAWDDAQRDRKREEERERRELEAAHQRQWGD